MYLNKHFLQTDDKGMVKPLNLFQITKPTSFTGWTVLSLMSLLLLSLYANDSFAAPTGMLTELKGLTDMSESANKTISWIAGGAALSLGSIWALVKQNILVFGSAVLIAVAAFKGSALVTATCLI